MLHARTRPRGLPRFAVPDRSADLLAVHATRRSISLRTAAVRVAAIAAFGFVLHGCAAYVEGRADAALLEALPRLLGPADRYEARVSGASADATHFAHISIRGVRIARSSGPVIEDLSVDLDNVVFDRPNRKVVSIGHAEGSATLLPADLAAYLAGKPAVDRPQVTLSPPDRISLDAAIRLPDVLDARPITFGARGRLQASGSQVRLAVDEIQVAQRAASGLVRGVVGAVLNPLIDLEDHAVPTRVDRVAVDADRIVVTVSGTELRPVAR